MSVSQRGPSTVCNHGNRKDVALTIIGSDGILYRCHTHGKPSSHNQSKGKVAQLASSRVRWDPVSVFCCCEKTFLWEGELSTLSSGGALLHIRTATESSWQRSNSTTVVQVRVAQGQLDLFT